MTTAPDYGSLQALRMIGLRELAMTEPSDIVERLHSNAVSWRRDDAMEGRVGEEEARLNDEAAAEITRLRAALAAEREACARVADDEREWALRRKKENVDEKDRDLEHWYEGEAEASERIAAAIRARASATPSPADAKQRQP